MTVLVFEFSPDEARDDHGRWTDGGGGDSPSTQATRDLADHYQAGSDPEAEARAERAIERVRAADRAARERANAEPKAEAAPAVPRASLAPPRATGVSPELQARVDKLSSEMGTTIRLSGVDPASQEGVVESMEKFHDAYPDAPFNVGVIWPDDPQASKILGPDADGTLASTGPLNGTTVMLNGGWYGDHDAMQSHVEGLRASGYTVQGVDDAAEQITDHELGHVLARSVGSNSGGPDNDAYVNAVLALKDQPDWRDKVSGVSRYASSKMSELIGESMASVYGPDPNPLASQVIDTLNGLYRKKYG